jgi:hypothetical protein
MAERSNRILILLLLFIFPIYSVTGQSVDSSSFQLVSRLSFYSAPSKGEFLLHIPPALSNSGLSVIIKTDNESFVSWKGKPGKTILRLSFDIKPGTAPAKVRATIKSDARPGILFTSETELMILSHKPNEVKTDRLTGGLIVNNLPFFPFGFYCYSPVNPSFPEEEVVRGFNMISPYQKITPETMEDRKAYMDRCAQIGMKVHYNLLSVSGGGGVGSSLGNIGDDEKKKLMIDEIKTFMDHPALLGWYISDEPNGRKVSPGELENIYRTVREIDPWHPVSIVFMTPFLNAKKYSGAFDIVMADPYPVPDHPISMPGDAAAQLKNEFAGKKPVWIVPQAFGGGELWSREPTVQEIRSMTWQAIINGATGIQYFVRQGPNYFPKSTATWSECGRMAVEAAELTPWLLSDEQPLAVVSGSGNVQVTSRVHNDQLAIMAVNKINEPVSTTVRIAGLTSGKARVLFENRTINFSGGIIRLQLSPFGTQFCLIDIKPEKDVAASLGKNLIVDPGFEDLSSPGLPSACYVRPGGDHGATYFLDTRVYYEGGHSLRIVTPQENKSLAIRFFPVTVKAGSSYSISLWAKSDPEQHNKPVTSRQKERLYEKTQTPQYAEIMLGDFIKARFEPDDEWREYITFITIPSDTLARFKTNLILKMPGQGVAWFDKVTVTEDR